MDYHVEWNLSQVKNSDTKRLSGACLPKSWLENEYVFSDADYEAKTRLAMEKYSPHLRR